MPQEGKVDLSGLFPSLRPDELEEAEQSLREYLGVTFRISDRRPRDVPPEPVVEVASVR